MDNKPLVQDRPPPYNTVSGGYNTVPGPVGYNYGQNYGAIPQHAAPQHPPPPYHGQGYPPQMPPVAQQPNCAPNCAPNYTIIQPSVVVVGGCPACRVGVLEEDFTCCGILCAILFFPIGIICCLAMRQRMCPNCGATFG